MSNNPLIGLRELGQSVWLDNLSRKLINSGEMKRLIDEDGLSGITSNPTIFQKAMSGSSDYDGSLKRMIGQARITIDDRLDEAKRLFQELKTLGIEIGHITEQLEREGVKSFSDSYFSLLKEIAIKRDSFLFQTQAWQRRNP